MYHYVPFRNNVILIISLVSIAKLDFLKCPKWERGVWFSLWCQHFSLWSCPQNFHRVKQFIIVSANVYSLSERQCYIMYITFSLQCVVIHQFCKLDSYHHNFIFHLYEHLLNGSKYRYGMIICGLHIKFRTVTQFTILNILCCIIIGLKYFSILI
jgi:hypothetical protein